VQKHKTIENVLDSIDKSKYQIPEDWPFDMARKFFSNPEVVPPEVRRADTDPGLWQLRFRIRSKKLRVS
jgi:flap endonuclease-1